MSSILTIKFSNDFEKRYTQYKEKILGSSTTVKAQSKAAALPTPKSKTLTVQLKQGLLTLNESTGLVQLNDVKENINPQGQEFITLRKLMSSEEYLATYTDLLGDKPSKDAKRNLGFVIRNIKGILGILPKEKSKNADCILNIKGHGYKLIT